MLTVAAIYYAQAVINLFTFTIRLNVRSYKWAALHFYATLAALLYSFYLVSR
jgi:hypothetical protein